MVAGMGRGKAETAAARYQQPDIIFEIQIITGPIPLKMWFDDLTADKICGSDTKPPCQHYDPGLFFQDSEDDEDQD